MKSSQSRRDEMFIAPQQIRPSKSRRDEMFIAPRASSNPEPIHGRQINHFAPKGADVHSSSASYKHYAATRLESLSAHQRSFHKLALSLLLFIGLSLALPGSAHAACSSGPCVRAGPRQAIWLLPTPFRPTLISK
jgi:hypothetical protein